MNSIKPKQKKVETLKQQLDQIVSPADLGPARYTQLQRLNDRRMKDKVSPSLLEGIEALEKEYPIIDPYDPIANYKHNVPTQFDYQTNAMGDKDYWGSSMFDSKTATAEQMRQLSDIRAENQPWYSKIANGTVKAGVNFVTTATEGILGIPSGIIQGISNAANGEGASGFIEGLWNNPINNAMKKINDAAEYYAPNYYTEDAKEHPMALRNIFSANTIGDTLIKNLGFMVGAFYGGLPYSAALGKVGTALVKSGRAALGAESGRLAERALSLVDDLKKAGKTEDQIAQALGAANLTAPQRAAIYRQGLDKIRDIVGATRFTTQAVGTVGSAMTEGAIEAVNNSNDWANQRIQQAQDNHNARVAAIKQRYGNSEIGVNLLLSESQRYQKELAAVQKEKKTMGNMDFLANIPILTASNVLQLGHLYRRGFNASKRDFDRLFPNKDKIIEDFKNGTLHSDKKLWKGIASATWKTNYEGIEEYLQRSASDAAGETVNNAINNYINGGKSESAINETLNYVKNFANTVASNLGNESYRQEYFGGVLGAIFGMPVAGKSNTQNAVIGKGKSFGIAGGFMGHLNEYKEKMNQENTYANQLNDVSKNIDKRRALFEQLAKTNDLDKLMQGALSENDKKKYKDLEFDQLFNDINAASAAGLLDTYKEMVSYDHDYTAKDLADIVDSTTKHTTADQQRTQDKETSSAYEAMLEQFKKGQEELEDKRSKTGLSKKEEAELEAVKSWSKVIEQEKDRVDQKIAKNEYKDKDEGNFINASGRMDVQKDKNGVVGGEMIDILERNKKHILDTIDDIQRIKNEVDIETNGVLSDKDLGLLTMLKAKVYNAESRIQDMSTASIDGLREAMEDYKGWNKDLDDKVQEAQKKYDEASSKHNDVIEATNNTLKENGITQEEADNLIAKDAKYVEEAKKTLDDLKKQQDAYSFATKFLDFITKKRETTRSERKAIRRADKSVDDKLKENNIEGVEVPSEEEEKEAAKYRNMTTDEIVSTLVNDPNNLKDLEAIIYDPHNTMTRYKKDELYGMLNDLHQLGKDKIAYNKKLRELIGDLSLIQEAYRNAADSLSQEQKEQKAKELSERIKASKNMSELNDILRESNQFSSEVTDMAIKKAKESGDDNFKSFMGDYENLNTTRSSLFSQTKDIKDPQVKQHVESTLADAWNNSLAKEESSEDFIKRVEEEADRLSNSDGASIAATEGLTPEEAAEEAEVRKNAGKELSNILKNLKDAKTSTTTHNRKPNPKPFGNLAESEGEGRQRRGTSSFESRRKNLVSEIKEAIKNDLNKAIDESDKNNGNITINSIDDLNKSLKDKVDKYNEDLQKAIDNNKEGKPLPEKITDDTISNLSKEVNDEREKNFKDKQLDITDNKVNKAESSEYESSHMYNSEISNKMKEEVRSNFISDLISEYIYGTDVDKQINKISTDKNGEQGNAIREFLESHKAYSFVDKGILGYANERHKRITDGGTLPIYFIKTNNSKINTGNLSPIFLAVEIDDDFKRDLGKYQDKDVLKPIIAVDKDGNSHEYQIVGLLGTNKDVDQKLSETYTELTESINEELAGSLKTNEFAVSDKISFINKVYTGRLVTHTKDGEGKEQKVSDKIPLKDFLEGSMEWQDPNLPQDYYLVGVADDVVLPEDDSLQRMMVKPSENWVGNNKGAVLLYVRRADGLYYPISLKRISVSEWWDSEVEGKPAHEYLDDVIKDPNKVNPRYLGHIVNLIKTLSDKEASVGKRANAKETLWKYLLLGKNAYISFDKNEDGFSIKFNQNEDSIDISNTDQGIRDFFEACKDHNILFSAPLGVGNDIRNIVNANVFKTGVKEFYNYNANFTIRPIDKDGNFIEVNPPENIPTGTRFGGINGEQFTINIDGNKDSKFIRTPDGEFKDEAGHEVTDQNRIRLLKIAYKLANNVEGTDTYVNFLLQDIKDDKARDKVKEILGDKYDNLRVYLDPKNQGIENAVFYDAGDGNHSARLMSKDINKDTLDERMNIIKDAVNKAIEKINKETDSSQLETMKKHAEQGKKVAEEMGISPRNKDAANEFYRNINDLSQTIEANITVIEKKGETVSTESILNAIKDNASYKAIINENKANEEKIKKYIEKKVNGEPASIDRSKFTEYYEPWNNSVPYASENKEGGPIAVDKEGNFIPRFTDIANLKIFPGLENFFKFSKDSNTTLKEADRFEIVESGKFEDKKADDGTLFKTVTKKCIVRLIKNGKPLGETKSTEQYINLNSGRSNSNPTLSNDKEGAHIVVDKDGNFKPTDNFTIKDLQDLKKNKRDKFFDFTVVDDKGNPISVDNTSLDEYLKKAESFEVQHNGSIAKWGNGYRVNGKCLIKLHVKAPVKTETPKSDTGNGNYRFVGKDISSIINPVQGSIEDLIFNNASNQIIKENVYPTLQELEQLDKLTDNEGEIKKLISDILNNKGLKRMSLLKELKDLKCH